MSEKKATKKTTQRCGVCKKRGHNARNCPAKQGKIKNSRVKTAPRPAQEEVEPAAPVPSPVASRTEASPTGPSLGEELPPVPEKEVEPADPAQEEFTSAPMPSPVASRTEASPLTGPSLDEELPPVPEEQKGELDEHDDEEEEKEEVDEHDEEEEEDDEEDDQDDQEDEMELSGLSDFEMEEDEEGAPGFFWCQKVRVNDKTAYPKDSLGVVLGQSLWFPNAIHCQSEREDDLPVMSVKTRALSHYLPHVDVQRLELDALIRVVPSHFDHDVPPGAVYTFVHPLERIMVGRNVTFFCFRTDERPVPGVAAQPRWDDCDSFASADILEIPDLPLLSRVSALIRLPQEVNLDGWWRGRVIHIDEDRVTVSVPPLRDIGLEGEMFEDAVFVVSRENVIALPPVEPSRSSRRTSTEKKKKRKR